MSSAMNQGQHPSPETIRLAQQVAPRGRWLAGMAIPAAHFWPRPQNSTGALASAPYACRCEAGDSWACRMGRCPCSGREKSLQPSERPAGYGADVPAPLLGLPPSCCAIRAWLARGPR